MLSILFKFAGDLGIILQKPMSWCFKLICQTRLLINMCKYTYKSLSCEKKAEIWRRIIIIINLVTVEDFLKKKFNVLLVQNKTTKTEKLCNL